MLGNTCLRDVHKWKQRDHQKYVAHVQYDVGIPVEEFAILILGPRRHLEFLCNTVQYRTFGCCVITK